MCKGGLQGTAHDLRVTDFVHASHLIFVRLHERNTFVSSSTILRFGNGILSVVLLLRQVGRSECIY